MTHAWGLWILLPMKAAQLQTNWHNRVYLDPDRPKRHIESFWIKANDPTCRRAIWVRFTLFAKPGEQHGDTWAIFFDGDASEILAAKETFPIDRVTIDPERAGIGIGESAFEDTRSHGIVRDPTFRIAWQLELHDDAPPHLMYPTPWFYQNSFFPQKKTICPHPDARLRGWLEICRNGSIETIDLAGWRGMQGHVWGPGHIERYAWCHCNMFDGVDGPGYLDIGSAQIRVGPILTPVLTVGQLVLGDKTYRFNRVRDLRRHESVFAPMSWSFGLIGPNGHLRGKVTSRKEETVGLTYANPHGTSAYCLNSTIAMLNVELLPRSGDPMPLHSERAALEVTQLDPNHGIKLAL